MWLQFGSHYRLFIGATAVVLFAIVCGANDMQAGCARCLVGIVNRWLIGPCGL
jgi:hypothetical protein